MTTALRRSAPPAQILVIDYQTKAGLRMINRELSAGAAVTVEGRRSRALTRAIRTGNIACIVLGEDERAYENKGAWLSRVIRRVCFGESEHTPCRLQLMKLIRREYTGPVIVVNSDPLLQEMLVQAGANNTFPAETPLYLATLAIKFSKEPVLVTPGTTPNQTTDRVCLA